MPLLIDSSLALINHTGAYYIARDLVGRFGDRAKVRYWRLGSWLPNGVVRKLAARAMIQEFLRAGESPLLPWPEPRTTSARLFLDPLYVLRSRLDRNDIVLCHDVGPISHTQLYDAGTVDLYRRAYAKIKQVKPGMVFVSHASCKEFVRLFGDDFRFLEAIPLYTRSGALDGEMEPVEGLSAPFFLTVGALETRKNQIAALEGFEKSGLAQRGVSYVLSGGRAAGGDKVIERGSTIAGVRFLNYVSDKQLRWLYRNASAFVLPSLLEGFGMPALEAAQHGLIPIISSDGALVEAVGGNCMQVDPHDPADIARAMTEILSMGDGEKAAFQNRLRDFAGAYTKERFYDRWQDLLGRDGKL